MVVTIIRISVSDTDAEWHDITNIIYKYLIHEGRPKNGKRRDKYN